MHLAELMEWLCAGSQSKSSRLEACGRGARPWGFQLGCMSQTCWVVGLWTLSGVYGLLLVGGTQDRVRVCYWQRTLKVAFTSMTPPSPRLEHRVVYLGTKQVWSPEAQETRKLGQPVETAEATHGCAGVRSLPVCSAHGLRLGFHDSNERRTCP